MAHDPDQQQARSNALIAIQHTDHTRLPKPGQNLTGNDIAGFCKQIVVNGERYIIYPAAVCITLEHLGIAKEQRAGCSLRLFWKPEYWAARDKSESWQGWCWTLGAEWVDAHLRFGASSLYPALVSYLYEQPGELQAPGNY